MIPPETAKLFDTIATAQARRLDQQRYPPENLEQLVRRENSHYGEC